MSQWRLDWSGAWGMPLGEAVIRHCPEDFEVEELLGWTPDGFGEHLCLYLEKRGDNTEYLAGELARLAGCRRMDVSFCGLKDRNAVTRQWFSLYRPRGEDGPLLEAIAGRWKLLDYCRHSRKLRRGDHSANRFRLRLRQCSADPAAFQARWQQLVTRGCPNYFGPQRFGHGGGNLDRAAALKPRQLRGRAGFQAGLYLSAARSWCFNQWLAERVAQGDWQQPLPGDPGPGATGPLAGDDSTLAGPPLEARELAFLEQWPVFTALFRQTRMKPARRALVLRPEQAVLEWQGDDPLLQMTLPAGSFATAVLQELVTIRDASQQGASPGEAK
ncbi:MAG: tRNA pseudouridine(13) synthase TruD [Oleiphilaceae bacterium]|nr:tRNA pseudouridine(13) synthase TruD [Oleiphilaceae bacterium]